eukprot:GDKI01009820.1.p1 GENE.GDKI01009820.1~~GDKI01009820.1.p1  ORF type:complete len:135 (-),score=47.80 GDKI01009820.1:92-469(-)
MVLLTEALFLLELGKLYEKNQKTGSVWIWMKRHYQSVATKKNKQAVPAADDAPVCLIRATDGKNKISTVVSHSDVAGFSQRMSNVMRLHTDGLKKTPKLKEKKSVGGEKTGGEKADVKMEGAAAK